MQRNELRKELKFQRELLNLIETLKNIAGAEYHAMEKEKERFDRFLESFTGFFRVVDLMDVEHPLVRVVSDKLGLIVVTSDSGFMGGLNQAVVRAALAAQGSLSNEQVALVVIGEKGAGIMSERPGGFKFFPGINQNTIYEQAVEVKNYIVQEVLARRMGKVMIAYPRPISFSAQTVEVVTLLPCAELFDRDAKSELNGRGPAKGLLAEARKVIVESSFSDMVEYLASMWVSAKLYQIFEDSKLAEFSARAMHLEGSQQKVERNVKSLQHKYFKATHEQIDKGMRESFSASKSSRRRRKREAQQNAAA